DRDVSVDTKQDTTRNLDRNETIDSTLNKTIADTATNTQEQTDKTTGTEDTVVDESKNTDRTESNLYADTPQEDLTNDNIRWDYLTNARYINTNESMTDKTTTDRGYEETKTSNATENLKRDITETDTA